MGYREDNGHGMPTHLLRKTGEWVATPYQYSRRNDGFNTHLFYRGRWFKVPSTDDLEDMVHGCLSESPYGDIVEPDHPESWLVLLGLM